METTTKVSGESQFLLCLLTSSFEECILTNTETTPKLYDLLRKGCYDVDRHRRYDDKMSGDLWNRRINASIIITVFQD